MFRSFVDFERDAAQVIPQGALGYYAGGALDEQTLAENRQALARIKLRWKALSGVTQPDLRVSLIDRELQLPIIVAPVAFQGMAHPEGERATARAAARSGSLMVVSTTSNFSVREVAKAAQGALWFQLYMMKDREITKDLVRAAEAGGAKAIALTVDVPAWGIRERDLRNGFSLPSELKVESLILPGRSDFYDGRSRSDLASFIASRLEFGLTWDDLAWLKSITRLPIVLKGIGTADDAEQGVQAGAAAIWVSNHGGRQLDSACGVADILPEIAQKVAKRVPIVADGGVRRGTDVFKLVGLGATAVAIGRAALWALAVQGEEGVHYILERLRLELINAMCLTGCADLAATPNALHKVS
ncbi:4-hydroxymandelate oxidase [Bradyrhizobium sp. USDA 4461]